MLDMDIRTGSRSECAGQREELRPRGDDRRAANDRRRGSRRGLFEMRALREGMFVDRRRGERRDGARTASWWNLWRRETR